jgi:hypothetical protein
MKRSKASIPADRSESRRRTLRLIDPADLYSIGSAAGFLQLDRSSVEDLVANGYLAAIHLEARERDCPVVLIPAESVLRTMQDLDRRVTQAMTGAAHGSVKLLRIDHE